MDFTLRQLELFRAVARSRSFTRASEDLHVSQPAVSAQLRELEHALGVALLERSGRRGVRLTADGERVLEHAERILGALQDLDRDAADLRSGGAGRLTVGASTTVGEYLLPELLGRFRRAFPNVDLRAEIANTQRVVERVVAGDLDIGFVGEAIEHAELLVLPFASDEIVIVAASTHPLAKRRSVQPADLGAAELIAREAGSATRRHAEACLARIDVRPRIVMELGSNEAVKHAVLAELGIGMLSLRAVATELRSRRLRRLRIAGFRCIRTFAAVYRRGRLLSATERSFMQLVLGRSWRAA